MEAHSHQAASVDHRILRFVSSDASCVCVAERLSASELAHKQYWSHISSTKNVGPHVFFFALCEHMLRIECVLTSLHAKLVLSLHELLNPDLGS